jgi:anti-sigma B factor antagonist
MTKQEGIVFANQRPEAVNFWVAGRARMMEGLAIRRFAEQALQAGAKYFRVDLSDCTYMDSTFQGTLLCLHRKAKERQGELQVFSPSSACRQLLKQIGVDRVFHLVEHPLSEEPDADAVKLTIDCRETVSRELEGTLVDAHQQLAALDGPEAPAFRAVVNTLLKDIRPT